MAMLYLDGVEQKSDLIKSVERVCQDFLDKLSKEVSPHVQCHVHGRPYGARVFLQLLWDEDLKLQVLVRLQSIEDLEFLATTLKAQKGALESYPARWHRSAPSKKRKATSPARETKAARPEAFVEHTQCLDLRLEMSDSE